MTTIILLTISNIFMTFAWYGHLKYRNSPLPKAILISWLIASMEYCFQVPANRIGSYEFTTAQLKTIQEVHAGGVFRLLGDVFEGVAEVELSGGVRDDDRRGFLRFQEVVEGVIDRGTRLTVTFP